MWKFLNYKMVDVDVEDSASMQRRNIIEKFAAYTKQETHRTLFSTHLDEAANIKHQSIELTVTLIH